MVDLKRTAALGQLTKYNHISEEKGGVVTEDEAKQGKEQIQELTKQYETKVDELIEHKRQEIMAV